MAGVKPTSYMAPTVRKVLKPKVSTTSERQTTEAAANQITRVKTLTNYTQTTPQPMKTKTIQTTAAPISSRLPSTESASPKAGVKLGLCDVHTKNISSITDEAGCFSTQPIQQTSCQGFCNSIAIANISSPFVQIHCSCCKPQNFTLATVPMLCLNGGGKLFKYFIITECSCDSCVDTVYQAKLQTMHGNVTKLADKKTLN